MPARKRAAPEPVAARRRSGRLASTAQKSSYFEADEAELPPKKRRGRPPTRRREESTEEEEEEEEEEDDDDDDDDMPRRVEIVPLEKLRDDGGVAYEDGRLHKNTLLFLRDLKANNKRPWLKAHDGEYRRALRDWHSFIEAATQRVIEVDETVPELPVKDVVFRIHRDIRFTKDPTPYKPHFSAAWSRTGRKGPYAGYYVHCEPGASLVGGGLWHPAAPLVARLRRSIDRHPARWRRALGDAQLARVFFPGLAGGPDEAVQAFVAANGDGALKRRPLGYDAAHPDIGLLRLRSYTLATKIDAEALCGDDALDRVTDAVRALAGFVSFLNSVVMPDANLGEGSGSDGEEDDEDCSQKQGKGVQQGKQSTKLAPDKDRPGTDKL